MTEDRVREIIQEEVVSIIRGQIPELFGFIKTATMEFFDDQYASLPEVTNVASTTVVIVVGIGARGLSSIGTLTIRSPWCLTGFKTRSFP